MAVIKPTFTLVGNANTATTCAGPMSVAINLTAQPLVDGGATGCYGLSVDKVQAKTLVFTGEANEQTIFDGSVEGTAGVGGTVGGFIYMKNITASDLDIYIGIVADDGSASDLDQSGDTARLFTLKQGEFAFFPYDYTMDITGDAEGAATLEYFLFDRA